MKGFVDGVDTQMALVTRPPLRP